MKTSVKSHKSDTINLKRKHLGKNHLKLHAFKSNGLADKKDTKSTFKGFLAELRKRAKSEREKGDLFERAIRDFLKESPEYSFENVWVWENWPDLKKYNFSKKDLGIDVVAKERETGRFWAIQCKCFNENQQVSKQDIDSFFTFSGKNPFEVRLIVTTTNNWGVNALNALKNQTKECKILDLHQLEQADFEWSFLKTKRRVTKKHLREHQKVAVRKAEEHFKKEDRGKLIMACGTGKTFTSLRIVESLTPKAGNILFLAPSISLISQTLREYAWQRKEQQRYLAVCSDTKAGKDTDGYNVDDLQISPTTNPQKIAHRLKAKQGIRTIVFSTYQSLKQIKKAQDFGAPVFDLVICDEAHRTTGVEAGEQKNGKSQGNYFTRINDKNYVKAKKRLYMTATPRIYSEKIQSKAKKHEVEIHSMDKETSYGKEIYRLDFSTAIEKKLLSDYKVIILSINEQYMSDNIQDILKDTDLNLNDASRLVGCYKALRDQGDKNGIKLSRAVGFLNTIQASKDVKQAFQKVVKVLDNHKNDLFTCQTEHIDGGDSSIIRNKKLDWLKEDAGFTKRDEKICRILFNSKCLTEGVDVPSLDAVMFLHPRKSQVDVVQAVGRIMRKLEGKKYGYVILPVVSPAGKSPEQALNDNKTYSVVWQVLNALRSHDSQFNAMVNNLELNNNKTDKIKVIGVGFGSEKEKKEVEEITNSQISINLTTSIEEIEEKIYAKIVEKCGDRIYEEKWAQEIAKAQNTISTRIKSLLNNKPNIKKEFLSFHKGLKSCINEDVTEAEAVSMLSEHLITRPAFDKIFENYRFSESNPISKTMKKVLSRLDEYGFGNELKDLAKFYQGINQRIEKIDNSASRQKVIKELYENFIKTAFPKTAEKLGVAYTPIEIVDFILRSANEILKQEFNKGLTDEGVHVIDPFSGTGTFINRLISAQGDQRQSEGKENELIEKKDLPRKFKNELHANEILLLPYYVASINIEEAYYSRMGGDYMPYPKITLSDVFNRNEQESQLVLGEYFQENNRRIKKQQEVEIQVIVGNPPYSAGQKNENDANKNTVYPKLNQRIEETYVKESPATLNRNLYDSYIKAIRWATDAIQSKGGIIGFVHNASLVSERSTAGLRKTLVKEFDSIYCFNLRGNARTKGEVSKKEGGTVFGQSSMCPIAITFLVKKPRRCVSNSPLTREDVSSSPLTRGVRGVHHPLKSQPKPATIKYFEVKDYLSRQDKLEIVKDLKCVKGIENRNKWKTITPDEHGDWINQRDESFYQFMPLGDKKSKNQNAIFNLYSLGVATNRDSWVYNFDKNQLKQNMSNMIDFYNEELDRLRNKVVNTKNIDKLINLDEKKIKWSSTLKRHFIGTKDGAFQEKKIRKSSYRPFTKEYLYFDNTFNDRVSKNPTVFPKADTKNKVICVSGPGSKTFSVLMTDSIPCLDYIEKSQCFPLYWFDINSNSDQKSFLDGKSRGTKNSLNGDIDDEDLVHSITDQALNRFKNHYKNIGGQKNKQSLPFVSADTAITKDDIFYYIYGLLHSEDYRNRYKSNLDKDLPRIPMVPEFWEFAETGRKLADLHLSYEYQKPLAGVQVLKDGKEVDMSRMSPKDLRVQKIKIDKKDNSKIYFNDSLTIFNIPKEAWEYKINGWSVPKWVVERYQVKKDKNTDLVNDPNTYSKDPAYILKLLLSVITVSVKTRELVQSLPSIDFDRLNPNRDKTG